MKTGDCYKNIQTENVVQVYFTANIEAVCLDVTVSCSNYIFIAAYRPHGSTSYDVYYNALCNGCLETLFNTKHCVLFVCDIICPGIDWQNCQAPITECSM